MSVFSEGGMKMTMQHAHSHDIHAGAAGEVPVGAVLVRDDELIGEGFNCPITQSDPTAHAEIVALRNAAEQSGNYRLPNSTLYVTIEPCVMCTGALIHARVSQLVFGAKEPRAGAVCSHLQLLDQPQFNHRMTWQGGVCEDECAHIMKSFFARKRSK